MLTVNGANEMMELYIRHQNQIICKSESEAACGGGPGGQLD